MKRFNQYDNLIFDFDGTLADTAGEVLSCIEKAFNKMNTILIYNSSIFLIVIYE